MGLRVNNKYDMVVFSMAWSKINSKDEVNLFWLRSHSFFRSIIFKICIKFYMRNKIGELQSCSYFKAWLLSILHLLPEDFPINRYCRSHAIILSVEGCSWVGNSKTVVLPTIIGHAKTQTTDCAVWNRAGGKIWCYPHCYWELHVTVTRLLTWILFGPNKKNIYIY